MTVPLREFVQQATRVLDRTDHEEEILAGLHKPFGTLIAEDNWLPEAYAVPHEKYYQQYLLHCDPLERFCVVSFVWGPEQVTPIHNHTVWGLIGMLRGAEISARFDPPANGKAMHAVGEDRLEPGMIDVVSPRLGDIHQVRNAHNDRVSISIHVYGSNIGRVSREVFDPDTGNAKPFVSGFSSETMPNIWAEHSEASASYRA